MSGKMAVIMDGQICYFSGIFVSDHILDLGSINLQDSQCRMTKLLLRAVEIQIVDYVFYVAELQMSNICSLNP